ncbi:MAG: hypothetical protein ATN33_02265 [Epulopiscium sp. Nele67-Bin001]|nr:MAG: hypothetical protein ATN33_02265 [Epulopiscium sp. Nele67-Bin001]
MKYQTYKWTIDVKNAALTPFQSDTIWGHFIWAIKLQQSDDVFNKILNEFKQDEYKPWIISNAFPNNQLPLVRLGMDFDKPKLKTEAIKLQNFKDIISQVQWVSRELFDKMQDGMTLKDIYEQFEDIKSLNELGVIITNTEVVNVVEKNSINRLTNTTIEGALFSQPETFYRTPLDIYIKIRDGFDINIIKEAIHYITQTGYGKKASTGKGQINTISFEPTSFNEASGAFITLSNYIPKHKDYSDCLYTKVGTKKGKIADADEPNPFKSPFCYYQYGSIFRGIVSDNKGKMLDGLHPNSNIVQYGIPFTVGIKA